MKKCVVIGGGFAGLSAACFLSNLGFQVELIEASNKLGGRAYSFFDKENDTMIDNGQHILMGCYKETLEFIKLINAEENFLYRKNLEVNFLAPDFRLKKLKIPSLPYPINLLFGLLTFDAISFIDRLKVIRFFLAIPFYSDWRLKKLSAYQWLLLEKQNERIRKALWDFLIIGALNTNPQKASAKVFKDILIQIFFKGNKASTIILPRHGLSECYCNNAQRFIEDKGCRIILSETVKEFVIDEKRITKLITDKRTIEQFDYVITAVPLYSLTKILPASINSSLPELHYSPILNIHIWLKENRLQKPFYGLIGSHVHWIFNHPTHITIVISDADEGIEKDKNELFDLVLKELSKYAGIKKEDVASFKVIKEKRATFIPDNNSLNKRASITTPFTNLILAGDWIDTGLPSTIEGAVKSGRTAAELVKQS
jgi:squalene-associated FAD-dependent desaturase